MCINIERGSKKTLWNYNWHLSARNWRSPHRNCFMNEVTDVRKDLLVISIPMMSWSILEHWPQSWLEEAHIYKLFSYLNVFNWSVFVQVQLQCPIGRDSKVPQQFLDGDYNLYSFYISCNQGDYFFFFFTNFCWLSEAFNFLMIILAFPFHAFTPFKIK